MTHSSLADASQPWGMCSPYSRILAIDNSCYIHSFSISSPRFIQSFDETPEKNPPESHLGTLESVALAPPRPIPDPPTWIFTVMGCSDVKSSMWWGAVQFENHHYDVFYIMIWLLVIQKRLKLYPYKIQLVQAKWVKGQGRRIWSIDTSKCRYCPGE